MSVSTGTPLIQLSLPVSPVPRSYLVRTDVELYVGDLAYHNQVETRLQLSRPAARQATVRGLSFRQTNNEGEHRIDGELARLRHHLNLTLGPDGRPEAVVNQPELLGNLKALRSDWQRRFPDDRDLSPVFFDSLEAVFADPARLVRSLSESPELDLLLPALYDRRYAAGQEVEGPAARIAPLTGTLTMPLTTTVTRRPPSYPEVALDLLLTGTLDETRFPFDEARRLMQELTGVVSIDPVPEVQYLLTFEFDQHHNLLYAGRFVTCIYENLAMSKTVTMLGPDQPTSPTKR